MRAGMATGLRRRDDARRCIWADKSHQVALAQWSRLWVVSAFKMIGFDVID